VQTVLLQDTLHWDNIDGGVWKQGWEVTYDQKSFEEKVQTKYFDQMLKILEIESFRSSILP
jgi:hypothetical protein